MSSAVGSLSPAKSLNIARDVSYEVSVFFVGADARDETWRNNSASACWGLKNNVQWGGVGWWYKIGACAVCALGCILCDNIMVCPL